MSAGLAGVWSQPSKLMIARVRERTVPKSQKQVGTVTRRDQMQESGLNVHAGQRGESLVGQGRVELSVFR